MTGTFLMALQNECGELPLEFRRRTLQLQYTIKIKNSENHPAESIITDHWTNYYGKFNQWRLQDICLRGLTSVTKNVEGARQWCGPKKLQNYKVYSTYCI